jgi:hypothetical protein
VAPVALAALVVFMLAFPVSVTAFSGERQLEGLFGLRALPMWVSLPIIFALTVTVMATIAEEVARTFARFPPLEAYRLDILGSLAGIVAFTALSFLQLPPLAWGLVAAAGFVVLLGTRARRWQWAGLGVVVLLLGVQSLLPLYHWSPYNKVRATERPAERPCRCRPTTSPTRWPARSRACARPRRSTSSPTGTCRPGPSTRCW